jgi:hypothetical protein
MRRFESGESGAAALHQRPGGPESVEFMDCAVVDQPECHIAEAARTVGLQRKGAGDVV